MRTGKIHLYYGDGKGKSTAAVGLCIRALGAGLRVFFAQFIKDGSSSEITFLKEHAGSDFHYMVHGRGCFISGTPGKKDMELAEQTLSGAAEAMSSGDYDLVIMDEAIGALNAGLFSMDELLHILEKKATSAELVLTGRNPPPELLEICDLASEIKCVKHYYSSGRKAERGIEF